MLFSLGDPEKVEYFAEGRPATRAEILASMESGLPILRDIAAQEGNDALQEGVEQYDLALQLVPS